MLQKIGDSLKGRKVLAYFILIPLALVFAAWGAVGIVDLDLFGTSTYPAKVNGTRIELNEVADRWRETQSQFQQQFGTEMPKELRAAQLDNLLESFIRSKLVSERTRDAGYRVDAVRLRQYLESLPAFQIDGKFDARLAKAALVQRGISEAQFEADLRTDLMNNELQRAIQVSEFMTPRELARILALEDEQREVRYAILPFEKFASAPVAEAAIEEHYKKNAADFMQAESVRLQFAELRLEQVASQVVVTEADLQQLYAKNRDRYLDPEQRRARHVLIAIDDKTSDEAARKLAEDVLAQARAGKDFAALAQQYSKDGGSASRGGDLGWAGRDAFVGPFADAVFSMKPGELRAPVKTEFGYHVVRLDEIRPGRIRSYDEARGDLEAEFRRGRADELFGDALERVQAATEQPGADLEKIAQERGMAVQLIDTFERGAGAAPLGTDRTLQEVVFGDSVLNQRRIGGPVTLGDDRFVILRVLEHRKAAPKPLDAVRDEIVARLRKDQGTRGARTAADAAAKRLETGESFDQIAKELGITAEAARFVGRADPSVPAQVGEAVFAAQRPAPGRPRTSAISLDQGGAAVIQLTAVRTAPDDGNKELRNQRASQVLERAGQADVAAYVLELRRKADVQKNPSVIEQTE